MGVTDPMKGNPRKMPSMAMPMSSMHEEDDMCETCGCENCVCEASDKWKSVEKHPHISITFDN